MGSLTLDDALDALASVAAAEGLQGWKAPQSSAPLDALEAAIAPWRLPADLREFWRRVDTDTLVVEPYPQFSSPSFALSMWKDWAGPLRAPITTVSYTSHEAMSVELDSPEQAGGALWEWYVSGGWGFTRRFNSLPEWIAYVAELVERGRFARVERRWGSALVITGLEWADPLAMTDPPPPAAHPVHDEQMLVPQNPERWPAHWKARPAD